MASTDRKLLRLHVEAVWDVRLPSLVLNDVELFPDGSQPSWKLCAADQASGHVYIWRYGVTTMERETLRLRVNEALAFPPFGVPLPRVHLEVALSLVASPRHDAATAHSIARPLTEQDRALIEAFEPDAHDYYFRPEKQPLVGVVISGHLLSLAHSSRRTPKGKCAGSHHCVVTSGIARKTTSHLQCRSFQYRLTSLSCCCGLSGIRKARHL